MMKLMTKNGSREQGLSLLGFIFVLIIVALFAVVGMKVTPTVVEYSSIKKAIVTAKENGNTPREIQASFDKQATSGYIDSISGKDLDVTPNPNGGFDVSFSYEKKIELFGPVSLLIEYAATTAKGTAKVPR